MPLNHSSPTYLHILQNAFLIILCLSLLPLLTFFALFSRLISPYLSVTRHIKHHRKWRSNSSSTFRPRTILVTGVGMSKGLTLARIFYQAGHRVIGADFEPYGIPVSGHFSKAIEKFYPVTKPDSEEGSAIYVQDLISIIKKEKVELWVSCSGVASALDDGEAAEAIEKETSCVPIQFGHSLTETLHEKHSFISHTRKLGLNVPATHLVTSETEAQVVLYPSKAARSPSGSPPRTPGRQHIMKPVGMDDSTRADMTLLPLPTHSATAAHIKRLNPTPFRPFVLQQYIKGPEYCTHSLILNGTVKAFVACPSAELLMHYSALPSSSALSQAMLLYTQTYARKTTPSMTGHFSIDFLVDAAVAADAETRIGVCEAEVRELLGKLYPIECNPRAHTAVVAFTDLSVAEDLADAYLSILPSHEPRGVSNGHRISKLVVPKPGIRGTYWIGHDLVTRVLLPLLWAVRGQIGVREMAGRWLEFCEHVLLWREGTWVVWDPWPAWWLYGGYWPAMFLASLLERRWWSRVNVSTGKMFGC
jgi:hypothetical protein